MTDSPADEPRTRMFYPEVSKKYDKWIKTAGDNPIIMADVGFETYLAGWQAAQPDMAEQLAEALETVLKSWYELHDNEILHECIGEPAEEVLAQYRKGKGEVG